MLAKRRGVDQLRGGAGADALDGYAGSDFANYQGSTAAVSVNLLTGATSGGDAAGDTLTSIENLYGSSNARNIIGGAGIDTAVYSSSAAAMSVTWRPARCRAAKPRATR